jgi:DNA polymerase-3 subunit gamma/tau
LETQAALLGPAELTRAAEVVSKGLDEIRGATAPRLLLELICARVLLPGADHGTEGVLARLDRLERRLTIAGGAPSTAATAAVEERVHEQEPPMLAEHQPTAQPTKQPVAEPAVGEAPEPASPAVTREPELEPATVSAPEEAPVASGLTLVDVRRLWPDVLEAVKGMRRFAWVMLSQNASVHSLDGTTLTIALVNGGARDSFARSGSDEIVRQALIDKLGVDWRVEAIVDPSAVSDAAPSPATPARPAPTGGAWDAAPAAPDETAPTEPVPMARSAADAETTAAARGAIRPTRSGPNSPVAESARQSDAAVHRDDPSADGDPVSSDELLARELGAEIIEEIPHDS